MLCDKTIVRIRRVLGCGSVVWLGVVCGGCGAAGASQVPLTTTVSETPDIAILRGRCWVMTQTPKDFRFHIRRCHVASQGDKIVMTVPRQSLVVARQIAAPGRLELDAAGTQRVGGADPRWVMVMNNSNVVGSAYPGGRGKAGLSSLRWYLGVQAPNKHPAVRALAGQEYRLRLDGRVISRGVISVSGEPPEITVRVRSPLAGLYASLVWARPLSDSTRVVVEPES